MIKPESMITVKSIDEALAWLRREREREQPIQRFGMRGTWEGVLFKGDGTIEARRKDNGISNAGFDYISHAIGNRSAAGATAAMSHIAVGTGATAFAATQTALVTELNRQAATFAHTLNTKVFTFQSAFAAGVATGAITEAGVFNAASAGTMLDRVVFSVINKGADDSLTQTFTFTMS